MTDEILREEMNRSAFPIPSEIATNGLTKREFFAAMAMQGLCAHQVIGNDTFQKIAEYAVSQADCLLMELSR